MASKLSVDAIHQSLSRGAWLSCDLDPKKTCQDNLTKTGVWAKKQLGLAPEYRLQSVAQALLSEIRQASLKSPEQIAQARAILTYIEDRAISKTKVPVSVLGELAATRKFLSAYVQRQS